MNHARDALYCIPPDLPRDGWVKVAMAAQSAGLDFETFNDWSAQAGSYAPAAARDVWKSIKPGKGIGAGTLFRMAGDHGWRASGQEARPTQVAPARQTPPLKPHRPRPPGMSPAEVWGRGQPATHAHPYIVAKAAIGVPLGLLRVVPKGDPLVIAGESMVGALIVPCFRQDETPSSLQIIAPPETAERLKVKGRPSKLNLPGASLVGCHVVGTLEPAGVVFVCEGVGQAWACWQATGRAAAVAFGWGRIRIVAEFLRQKDPTLRLVLVPDVGKEQDADKIAAEVGVAVACMPEGWPQNSDVNDLAQQQGADLLAELLDAAKGPPKLEPRYKLLGSDDMAVLSPLRWCVRGVLPEHGVAALYGASASGKSFLGFDLAASIAEGTDWFDCRVTRLPVVYVALEGEAGFRARVQAWEQHNERKLALNLSRDALLPEESEQINDEYEIKVTSASPQIRAQRIGSLIAQLGSITEGAAHADDFEEWCLLAVQTVFAGHLANVVRKANGQAVQRRDIVGTNLASSTVWRRIETDYQVRQVVFDAKNYQGVGRDEYRQMSTYLNGPYGRLGFLITRDEDENLRAGAELDWVREIKTQENKLIIRLSYKFFHRLLGKLRNPEKHDAVDQALSGVLDTFERVYLSQQSTMAPKRKRSNRQEKLN